MAADGPSAEIDDIEDDMTAPRDSRGSLVHTVLPWLHYPVAMTATFALSAWMRSRGASLEVSTYVPIVIAALCVAGLEALFPHRAAWRPPADEIKTDLGFMTVVQLAFPPVMGFLFTSALVEPARALGFPTTAFWPHSWPVWIQVVLMILLVDLLRYWLHRASHETAVLWRLHAVHHSVSQLYWLNTARFHLVEKALQMSADSLPFLLMGVQPIVLSLYYVAYATNGFFQHCNVELRYGVLNYIVGSAETHRWHHSREPREANANYGSTVIIWDLVFGTWFLPRGREVDQLGLHDAHYPKSFLSLMGAPFKRQ
jgi:sterol desaturase/sphingolipid hydroxylase (fatty acid hydroxylase superfamily)